MPIFTATAFTNFLFTTTTADSSPNHSFSSLCLLPYYCSSLSRKSHRRRSPRSPVCSTSELSNSELLLQDSPSSLDALRLARVIQANEEKRKLIFSEKEAVWSKFSDKVKVGDIFDGRVGSVEDFGAFVYLKFPDGLYHLTGLVHVSEVSWDLVQDVRDILSEGEDVRVKVTTIDRYAFVFP